MTRRDELMRAVQAATATYATAKERHTHARKMAALGMGADIFGTCNLEARAFSEWLRATDALQNYRG
ncbi:hypothetical protein QCM77_07600 [Bradyrhizobium sp. SSUT18]|uniref:hypothetical protein n=1 Tax=Bradyrhizobium sp. SSUT18 TaxID=3040602 RepID=UPI002447F1C6|nr:hypothetical protein [Bradyrhizobium sp. SSUT18]MDH2399812.1 hypothetical protein [Bradyrhizobium sp. SSUT18]